MTWTKPTEDSDAREAIETLLAAGIDQAIALHHGSVSIASPAEGMLHANPGNGRIEHYRGGSVHVVGLRSLAVYQGGVSTDLEIYVPPEPQLLDVVAAGVLSDTASTSDASNLWTLDVQHAPSGLSLFSTPPTTNGDDLVADVAWHHAVDQNSQVAALGALRVLLTATGSPTALSRALVYVTVAPRYV